MAPTAMQSLAILVGLSTGANALRAPKGGKVRVELYYETMCPYCHHFINSTLMPMWNDPEMRQVMDLRMLPAGNVQVAPTAMVSEGYRYWHPEVAKDKYIYRCQHGESECLGNMIHSCAMKVLVTPEKYLPLMFCMAERTNHMPEKSSYECMDDLNIDMEPIFKCVRAPTANEEMFMITQADASLSQPRKYVPWVMVNGEHLEVNDGTAELKSAICRALGEAAPASCPPAAPVTPVAAMAVPAFATLGPAKTRPAKAMPACYEDKSVEGRPAL